MIEQRGCELLYLPSYSPDYNPLEEAFAKIEHLLRKAAARTKEALIDAIERQRSLRSLPRTFEVTFSMPGTALWVTYCETRCEKS